MRTGRRLVRITILNFDSYYDLQSCGKSHFRREKKFPDESNWSAIEETITMS